MDTSDWRDQLLPEAHQGTINKILETLKTYHPVYDQEGLLKLQKIAQSFEEKTCASATSESDYQRIISLKMLSIKTQMQEEVYEKIQIMKEKYLPELNEMYQKIATKLQQHDSLPQQPKSDQLEKLNIFKTMLERIIAFLEVPKSSILPNFKERLGSYEKQIINFINTNRPRKAISALQQG